MTDPISAEVASAMFDTACLQYRQAIGLVSQFSLLASALTIREAYPTATHLICGVSDQGSYLDFTAIVDPECDLDDNEIDYEAVDSEVANSLWGWLSSLDDDDPHGTWAPFVVVDPDPPSYRGRAPFDPTGRAYSFALDLDLILFHDGVAERSAS